MDLKNVKKRDVLPFGEFLKARETAMKAVMTKKGENPDPSAHAIKGEDLYVKHDANIYKASGIPHDEKIADSNNLATANQVDVQGHAHDGQDPTGGKKTNESEPSKADKKAAKDSAELIGNAYAQTSVAEVSESLNEEGKHEIILKGENILKKAGFTNTDYTISLQGPTVIFTKSGNSKITDEIKKSLSDIKMEIL
jgi:hypothetical protein